jgi:hypothetical protein
MTTASLRRRAGRWEIFAECLRPSETEIDELEVIVGSDRQGPMRVRVREQGDPVVEGPPALGPPRVLRGSFRDRWRCVIEVPERWVPPGDAMLLGVARAPGGVGTRQTGGLAVPSWMPMPLLALDPSGWWSGTLQAADPPVSESDRSPAQAGQPDGGG